MIESPKYLIDEPLTIGITSSGSHLKDSFGAKPILQMKQASPSNSGRRMRSQRSRENSPTEEYIPHKRSILQSLPGVTPTKIIVN